MSDTGRDRLPPDRSHVATERVNAATVDLHRATVGECLHLIHREDAVMLAAVERALPAVEAFIVAAEPGFCAGGRLIYVGAGTSGRLGVLDASEAPPTFHVEPGRVVGIIAGGDAALRRSSEAREDDPAGAHAELDRLKLSPSDAVIGIAAGGSTPYVLGALDHARSGTQRPLTALIACSQSAPTDRSDHTIVIDTGPEVLTGSTRMKAGTATKLVLNMISTTLMVRSGRVYGNLMVDLRATNDKLRDRAARIVSTLTGVPRPRAFELLDAAGGAAKTAIVMQRRSVDRAEAERLLLSAGGRLDRVIE